jgi:hypothetical protein
MTVEELEEEIHTVLDNAVWVNVKLRKNGAAWLLTINGTHFDMPSRKEGMRYLSLFFLKASTMDLPHG